MSCDSLNRHRRRSSAPTCIESLEPRELLSASHRAIIIVHPGDSIQAAIDAAAPNTDVLIQPGTYAQSFTVNKAGIHVIGQGQAGHHGVTLTNPGGADDGVSATAGANGFELDNVLVQGFNVNGVFLAGVDGFTLAGVIAQNEGDYGLFPVHCADGVITGCVASGNADTGIYVGQSQNVSVLGCTAFDNVEGITIENSSLVRVAGNVAHDNTAGISAVLLPLLSVKTSSDIQIVGNVVANNNHFNFGDQADPASSLPPGIGILVLGTDHTLVAGNVVTGNGFVGIGVGSSLLFGAITGLPPAIFADIEPNPDNDLVEFNVALHNGFNPIPIFGGADLIWDGSGTGNHWRFNVFATSTPATLP
jgi:parallel beta-helix repeat protein